MTTKFDLRDTLYYISGDGMIGKGKVLSITVAKKLIPDSSWPLERACFREVLGITYTIIPEWQNPAINITRSEDALGSSKKELMEIINTIN